MRVRAILKGSTGQKTMSHHGRRYSFHMFWNSQKWKQCARQTVNTLGCIPPNKLH